ncbi:MAG: DUF420 domain-containing protein [Planctomycetota bacterium]
MHRTVRGLPASLLLLAGTLVSVAVPGLAQEISEGTPVPDSDSRFYTVPDFEFTDRSGETVTLDALRGQPWIGVPFFVRCTGPCPSITRDIAERLMPLLEGTPIRVVSFSLDPTIDTPEKLDEYVELFDADDERWLFVRSDSEEEMHRFLNEGLKVPVQRDPGAEDPGLAIVHGTRMPVVDAEGTIAGWYELRDPSLDRPATGEIGLPIDEAEPILAGQYALIAARARALAGLEWTWPLPGPSRIPLVNASLNATAFVLLIAGYLAIRRDRRKAHELLMKSAFVVSAAFLGFYLYYHFVVLPISGGPTKYNGVGAAKVAYLLMLLTHVVLAIVNLPMVLRVLWLAHKEDWERHRRLARWTFPIWVYVSLTGVLVYLVLYPFNPPPAA